jgi:hypothetical protein
MKVKMDKEQWSEKSKNSYNFDHNIYEDFYEDIKYKCIFCSLISVFTGEDQKISFEIEKNYIWQRRKLCPACYHELQAIKELLTKCEELLSSGSTEMLNAHLSLLSKLPRYGRKINKSIENKIKLLQRKKS